MPLSAAQLAKLQADVTTLVADINMLVPDVPTPPQPPSSPQPPVGTLIPTVGSADVSLQFADGPADWVDTSKLPEPIPWSVYADPVNLILAKSQAGIRPTIWKKLNLSGNVNGLYGCIPMLRNGVIEQYNPQVGDDFISGIVPRLKSDSPPTGSRGTCLPSPYITWHGHPTLQPDPNNSGQQIAIPRAPLYVGIRADGAMQFYYSDGSIYDTIRQLAVGAHDFALNPTNRSIFYVADTFGGNILKVDRTAAIAARPVGAVEDANLWVVTVLAADVGTPTSVRVTTDGTIYSADYTGNRIIKIDPISGIVTLVCTIASPFALDYFSDGTLIVVTDGSLVFHITPSTGAVGPNLMPSVYVGPPRGITSIFTTISVDRAGTIGPAGEFYISRSHGVSNVDIWQFRIDGTVLHENGIWPAEGRTTVGNMLYCGDGWGHYPWIAECHPDQAILLCQGFADALPSVLVTNQSHFAPEDVYDHPLFTHGLAVLQAGSSATKPWGSVPSFTALMDQYGWSLLGCTADYVGQMAYADAAKFVQQGMIGSVPRPDIVGYDLLAVLYTLYRSSQAFLTQGATLIAGLRTYIGTVTATPAPSAPVSVGNQLFVQAKINTGGVISFVIEDSWNNVIKITDILTVQITADAGTSNSKIVTNISQLTAGQHGLSCFITAGATQNYRNRTVIITV